MLTRRAFGAGLATALAGCGGGRRTDLAVAPPPGTVPGSVLPARFSDDRPHSWGRRGPGGHAVHGIDVNKHQPSIDWNVARANGVNFAWVKATEGGDHDNPLFLQQWRGAGAAGVPRGAFHFYYFCTPPADQAKWFIRNVPKEAGSLPPALDLEWNPFSPTCVLRPPADEVRRVTGRWLDIVHGHYGQRPVIYTTIDFWEHNEMWKMGGEEFWLRSVKAHPSERYHQARWTFWQYSGTGRVPGIDAPVDLNLFAGNAASWAAWLAARQV